MYVLPYLTKRSLSLTLFFNTQKKKINKTVNGINGNSEKEKNGKQKQSIESTKRTAGEKKEMVPIPEQL